MRKILYLLGFLALPFALLAKDHKDGHGRDTLGLAKAATAPPSVLRSLPSLDHYFQAAQNNAAGNIAVPYGAIPEFSPDFIAANYPVAATVADNRSQAANTFSEIERKGNYTDYLTPNDLVELPVGIKKKMGNTMVTIGVSRAKFMSQYSELTIFCKIEIPQGKKTLFFGLEGVKLSNGGGLIGDANLVLLGDFQIPINGNNSMLVLKGGMDMRAGDVSKLTYATLQCGGIKEFGVEADVVLPRGLVKPVDANYNVIQADSMRVKGSFRAVVNDWNNILATVRLPLFAINGLDKLCFEVTNATFDFSDFQNATNMNFPQGYGNVVAGNTNLWRGIYIKNMKVFLPKEFKKKGRTERTYFEGQNILIDNWGFTGLVSANNVFQDGSASGWDFSLDRIEVNVQANVLRGASFQGAIALPVSKAKVQGDSVKKYGLGYSAIFTADNGYLMNVSVQDSLAFDIWKARVKLDKGSFIELASRNDQFRPRAFLNGSMNIAVVENGKTNGEFKGIVFQGIKLQTESPYFEAAYLGYENTNQKVANFPVTIYALGLRSLPNNELAINATIRLNFMAADTTRFSVQSSFSIVGQVNAASESFDYTYRRFEVSQVIVAADFGSFQLDGTINFLRDHPIMGNGFAGSIKLLLKVKKDNPKTIESYVAFGSTTFRYWYVDVMVKGISIDLGAGVKMTGLGGGASYRMLKTTQPATVPGVFPSGTNYIPDANSGLSFRAMTSLVWGASDAANGDVCLEMAFNPNLGMSRIGLFGRVQALPSAALKARFNNIADMPARLQGKMTNLTSKVLGDTARFNGLVKQAKFLELAQAHASPDPSVGQDATINAAFGLEYDFDKSTFIGNFDVTLNAAGGMITGYGKARMKFAPNTWYIHIGRSMPAEERITLRFKVGSAEIETRAYFMIGDSITPMPPVPQAVTNILGNQLQVLNFSRSVNDLAKGRGYSFGADFRIATGNINYLIFYANFQAGLGFDIMLRDYGNTYYSCSDGTGGSVGMNGWYASGQAYAYLQGELGVQVKVWFFSGRIPIIRAGAAVLVQGRAPNPSWFAGYVAGNYSVLGGAVRGSFNMRVTIGKDCTFQNNNSLSDVSFITDILPEANAEDIDVLSVPQAVFRLPINDEGFDVEDLQAQGGFKKFRVKLQTFTVTNVATGAQILGQIKWSDNKDAVFFESTETLPASTALKTVVEVSYEQRSFGYWRPVYKDGVLVTERKEATFTTGALQTNIPLSNIAYSYPVVNQKYFHTKETSMGFIKLKRGQSYLIPCPQDLSVKFTSTSGAVFTAACQYDAANKAFQFTMPNLSTSTGYKFELMRSNMCGGGSTASGYNNVVETAASVDLGEGSTIQTTTKKASSLTVRKTLSVAAQPQIAPTALLTYDFRTSLFTRFADKMAYKTDNSYSVPTFIDNEAIILDAEHAPMEAFDKAELFGVAETSRQPLIQAEATLSDDYYNAYINPVLYQWGGWDPTCSTLNTPKIGRPPFKTVDVRAAYGTWLDNNNPSLATKFPYQYNAGKYYLEDYRELRNNASALYGTQWTYYCIDYDWWSGECIYGTNIPPYPNYLSPLMEQSFPQMPSGQYTARFSYKLPNGVVTSSYEFNYNYSSGN